jgi:hypothetical protein
MIGLSRTRPGAGYRVKYTELQRIFLVFIIKLGIHKHTYQKYLTPRVAKK